MSETRFRLVRALWVLLALNSLLVFGMTQWVTWQFLNSPPPRITAGLAATGISLAAYGAFFFITTTITYAGFFVVALLIFLNRPRDGYALVVAIFFVSYGAAIAYPYFTEFSEFHITPPLWYAVPAFLAGVSSWCLIGFFFGVFPDGAFVPRWVRPVCFFTAGLTLLWLLFQTQFEDTKGPIGIFGAIASIAVMLSLTYAQVWRYRYHFSPGQRQQIKWFLYALGINITISVVVVGLPVLQTNLLPPVGAGIWGDIIATVGNLSAIVLPIGVGIAILRYRLFDIDVIIRRTLTYAIVAAMLVVIYFGSVILLQQVFASITGQRSEVVTVLSTLAIAALFVPVRNGVQKAIDRRFYRKKYNAQQVLADFGNTVRDETDLDRLTGRLIEVVDETMQPKSVSLWLNQEERGGTTH